MERGRKGWVGAGVYKGEGGKTPTLGLEVITVLCTQNNWSHQCGCHMESLALPRHRCSPFSGQNPPIKPKLVAKRPFTPPTLIPWVRGILQHLHSSQSSAQFEGKQRRTGLAVSRGYSFPQIQSSSVVTSGKDLICTSAAKPNVTAHAIWPRLPSLSKSQLLVLLLLLFYIQRRPRALKTY